MSEKKRTLNLFDTTLLVAGSMIGSGIFIVSSDIARSVGSAGWLLVVWILSGVITLFAALSYGELAGMMPQAGGQFVYIKKAFGDLVAFVYGWTVFLVIQTGVIAAVAVAFAKFTGVFFPTISADHHLLSIGSFHINTQQVLAICVIVFWSVYNFRDVKAGALMQNIFTIAKVTALLLLICAGLYFGFSSIKGRRDSTTSLTA